MLDLRKMSSICSLTERRFFLALEDRAECTLSEIVIVIEGILFFARGDVDFLHLE